MRRRSRALAAVALLLALAWALVGCTSTVHRPRGPLAAPVVVLLAQDGRHLGLLLPRGGRYVEYGFGEYAWYAELRDAWYRAFPAMLWPTAGTIGRREVEAADAAGVRRRLWWMQLDEIPVEGERAAALLARLDARFAAGGPAVHNPTYGIDFAADPDGYWCLFNCNDAVAGWLEELGCRVSWVPLRLDLEVEPAPDEG
jgi:hypothetical protein